MLNVVSCHVPRLLNILEVIAPFKQFGKLREFLEQRLPPGFPVKIGNLYFVCDTVTVDGSLATEILHLIKILCTAADMPSLMQLA